MKLKLFVIIFLLLLIPLALSKPVDFDKAYVWLYAQQQTDVTQAALTAISISKIDPVKAQLSIDYLKNNKNPNQPCWPTNCDPSSTAFVLLALNNGIIIEGVTVEDVKNWLELAQLTAPLPGNWYLQIVTSSTGSCDLTYSKKGSTTTSAKIPLTVDKGKLSSPSCSSGSNFLDIRSCISPDIFSKASTQMIINCPTLTDAKISVIYKENNAYYLVSESYSLTADITLNNGYFGTIDSTYYVNWALKISNSNVNSLLYLKKTANINSVKDMALLSLITNNAYYQTRLSNLKSQIGGYFGQTPNLWENALAAIALGQADTSLQEWFGSQQNANGYWQDKKTTALILYALGGTATLPECITGQLKPCSDLGICKDTLQTCNQEGKWPGCSTSNIQGYSATDLCGNALDDNCDGSVDEGCDCDPTATPSEQCGSNIGICRYGTRICDIATKKWSACIGGITSSREAVNTGNTCFDNLDNDCDGLINCNDLDCQVGTDWDRDSITNDRDSEVCTPYSCRSDIIREGRSEFIGKAKDQDSDGLCDSLDQCDNTALGCPVYSLDSNDRVGCPSDCSIAACREGPDNACRFSSCERDCGSGGIFDSCDRQECSILSSSLNGCIYKESLLPWLYNSCLSCSTSTRCSTYPDETECLTDPCKLGCEFKDNSCVEKPKINFYEDKDEDGFGNPSISRNTAIVPEGYVSDNTDCDDNDVLINPSAAELCGNNKDDDCKDGIDEDCSCAPTATDTCPLPQSNALCTKTCSAQGQWLDCDTSGKGKEDTQSSCSNGRDDDCDGFIDCLDPDCGGKDCNNNGRCSNFDADDDSDGFLDTDGTDQELCTPQDCLSLVVFGKAVDDDNDGVCDQKDKCKGTALGCSPVETTGSRIGCPPASLCDQSASCRDNDPSCACPTCVSCSDWAYCNYEECSACAGSCFFNPGILGGGLGGTCNECSSSSRCSNYLDERDCSSDSCSKGPCFWIQSSNTCCEDKNRNSICDTQDQPTKYYRDHDTDTVGSTDSKNLIAPEGEYTALISGDCDDTNANINPSAAELCGNNKDDNCKDGIDEDCSCAPTATDTCPLPQSNAQCKKTCSAQGQWLDCDTSGKGKEDTQSSCSNGRDDDCDGFIDCLDPDCGFDATQGNGDCDNDGTCDLFENNRDRDNDRVLDNYDQEKCTPQNCISTVNPAGVKLDSDSDGVCNAMDTCDTAPSCPVDQTGCVLDCQANSACLEDPSCTCQYCTNCGGILGTLGCEYQECSKCATGNCRYEGWISSSTTWGSCLACTPTDTCSTYKNQEDCSTDPCSTPTNTIGPCEWSGTSCVETPKTNFYEDKDEDGFGNPGVSRNTAIVPDGYVSDNTDCNDNNLNIKPSATEICDNIDNDCDPLTTEIDCSCAIDSPPRSCPKQFGICSGVKENCIDGRWSSCNYGSNYLENENTPAACTDDLDNDCDNSKNCNDPDCSAFDYDTDGTCDQSDPDKDGDSVPNGQDKEEFTHIGCPVWKQSDNVITEYIGKAKDQDEDGICDTKDTQCPNTDKGCQVLGYDSASAGCPADCASCPNDISCNCDDCGAGISFCTDEACLTLGEEGSGCFFKPRSSIFSYNYCYDCTGRATSCASYLTPLDCETNQCLNNENTQCAWDTTSRTCKLKPKTTYYYDLDNDGFGSQTNIQQSYTQIEGYIVQGGDCNDNNQNIKPGTVELCDGLDNNCQTGIDEGCSCQTGQIQSCSQGTYGICTQAQSQTCGQDGTWPGCNYASLTGYQSLEETLCDGLDNDCDGTTDESCPCVQGTQRPCSLQTGVCSVLKETCTAGAWPGCNYVSITGYQLSETLCDGLDNDCDGTIDENNCACIDNSQKNCPNQQGVCSGSKEICTNGVWPGCTKTNYGTSYVETESTQELCINNKDDDCDGLIDCLDQSCPNGGDFDKDIICNLKDDDKDGDGIPNTNDKEEFTPLGCKVDTFNPGSLGKQLDSDNDKICDGLDKCEKTIPTCLVQGYTSSAPGCPADCEALTCVTDPSCECKTCAKCISGTFDFCSQEECTVCGQGSCWFQPKDLAKDTCEACTTAKSCNTYLTQPDCSRNSCYGQIKGLNCTWSTNSNCCIDNDKNGVCDNAECEPEWDCGQWSICSSTDTAQRRLCTDEASCGIACPADDTDCITERACSACTPEWWCNDWSECTSGAQTRDCRDLKDCAHACPTADTTCLEQRSCDTCTPDWECTAWSECEDGIKTRTCEDNNNCEITCSTNEAECIEDQLCTIEEEPTSSCGNTKCESEAGENQATCPTDCTAPVNPCVVDGSCDPQFGEDETNCPEDCKEDVTPPPPGPTAYCGDGTCDSNEDNTLCPEDCETTGTGTGTTPTPEPTKSKLWLYIILILLLVLLVAAYFLFFKKPSKKNKKPFGSLGSLLPQAPTRQPLFGPQSNQPPRKPVTPTREKPRKSLVEDELEKSIREAGKLIGK